MQTTFLYEPGKILTLRPALSVSSISAGAEEDDGSELGAGELELDAPEQAASNKALPKISK